QLHNEQVYADATLKGKYPFRLVLHSRQSNSPYFSNYTDLNVEFNHQAYRNNIDRTLITGMEKKVMVLDSVKRFEEWINRQTAEYTTLENWIENPARTGEIVREKEKLYQEAMSLAEQKANLGKDSSLFSSLPGTGRPAAAHGGGPGIPMSKDSLMA